MLLSDTMSDKFGSCISRLMIEMKNWGPAWTCPEGTNKLHIHVFQTLMAPATMDFPQLTSGASWGVREKEWSPVTKWEKKRWQGQFTHEFSPYISASRKIDYSLQPHPGMEGQAWKEILPVGSVMSSTNGHWLVWREKSVLSCRYTGTLGPVGMAWLLCQGVGRSKTGRLSW